MIARNLLGVMEGRLVPKYKGRFQAHPVGKWQEEFSIAAGLELDCIEFILDYDDFEANPFMTKDGLEEIRDLTERTGIRVNTVCADYFMEAPLHSPDRNLATRSQGVLRRLLDHGRSIGLTDIVVPCVDQSSLGDRGAEDRLIENLKPFLEGTEATGINLSLETDLAPRAFAQLLERCGSDRVTVNYDTGNSAGLGYDPEEELACYGRRISDIHIKDRVRGGGSVELGTGDANFERFFAALRPLEYTGPFIIQAYRDEEGLEIFRRQLDWLRRKHLSGIWT